MIELKRIGLWRNCGCSVGMHTPQKYTDTEYQIAWIGLLFASGNAGCHAVNRNFVFCWCLICIFFGDYWMDGVIFLVNSYRPRRIPLDTRKPGDAEDLSTEQSEEMLIAFGRNLWAAADVPWSLVIVQCRSVILER